MSQAYWLLFAVVLAVGGIVFSLNALRISQRDSERARVAMAAMYVRESLARAIGVDYLNVQFTAAPDGGVAQLSPRSACWVRTVAAFRANDGSLWLNPNEVDSRGTDASWTPGAMLLYRNSAGQLMALRFGSRHGLLTQSSGGFEPAPSQATHTLEVIDLGGMPDSPLQ